MIIGQMKIGIDVSAGEFWFLTWRLLVVLWKKNICWTIFQKKFIRFCKSIAAWFLVLCHRNVKMMVRFVFDPVAAWCSLVLLQVTLSVFLHFSTFSLRFLLLSFIYTWIDWHYNLSFNAMYCINIALLCH
jgi:hypothetical protein